LPYFRSSPIHSPLDALKRLPVWVSKADIVAYLRLSPTDAQALVDSADRRCLIDGVEKISKYQLQSPPYPDLIRVMQRHPSPVDTAGVPSGD
jgi:hypothetical protein